MKPVLIIYNPSCGRRINLLPKIQTRFEREKIAFEVLLTKKKRDTYFFARDADLTKFSSLIACGGDGTYHEVVNGMLARADKLKLPIGIIPNGFNNATCRSMGIMNLEIALDFIVNAEVIPVDLIRVLIDHETPEEIPHIDTDVLDHCRYMLNDCLLAMSSRVANKASRYKKRCYCFGRRCFITAALQETIFGSSSPDMFTIEVDGVRIDTDRKETTSSVIFMLLNGKFTGGGGVVDPFACMNDGLVDLTWLHDETRQGLFSVGDFWIKAKKKHAS